MGGFFCNDFLARKAQRIDPGAQTRYVSVPCALRPARLLLLEAELETRPHTSLRPRDETRHTSFPLAAGVDVSTRRLRRQVSGALRAPLHIPLRAPPRAWSRSRSRGRERCV